MSCLPPSGSADRWSWLPRSPALRRVSAEAPRAAAAAYNRVAWPAFGLLIVTGVWNIVAEGDRGPAHRRMLGIKLAAVAVSGVAAFAHARASTPRLRGVLGALSGLTAVFALLLGVLLAQRGEARKLGSVTAAQRCLAPARDPRRRIPRFRRRTCVEASLSLGQPG